MKKLLQLIIVGFIYFLLPQQSFATHIIGGELTYKCLGNNKYEIFLTVYRDCATGQAEFDNPAYVGIFNDKYQLIDSVALQLNPDDTLDVVLSDTCLVVPKNVCVHTTTYSTTIELKSIPGGYILAYQRCCRNQAIANIVNPLATGATFSTVISEKALNECNNSSTFTNYPPIFICVNEPIVFDHSAKDVDNDSIYYRLCTPSLGANQQIPYPIPSQINLPLEDVVWKAPYGLNNVLGGTPLKIDAKTGLLTGLPNTIGKFVVGICAEEYRKGILISTNRRDFQYNVGLCGSSGAAIFAPKVQCDNLAVKFDNKSTNANKYLWDFGIENITTDTSTQESPTYTFPKEGTYIIRLIAQPGSACSDTAFHTIRLDKSSLIPDFTFTIGDCTDSLEVKTDNKSFDPAGEPSAWEWKMYLNNDTLKSTQKNPILKPFKSGNWKLELTAYAINGCPKVVQKDVTVSLINVKTLDTVRACIGENLVILAAAPSIYTYQWSPPNAFTDPTKGVQTVVVTSEPKTYSLTITSSTCKSQRKITVLPSESTPKLTITANPDTIILGKTSQLEATLFPPNYKYTWNPSNSLSSDKISNPVASPLETTDYTLTVTPSGSACPAVATIRLYVRFPDCDEPYVYLPNAFTPNDDGANDVLFVRGPIKSMFWAIYNRWGEKVFESSDPASGWDGYMSNTPLPPDVYGYYLEIICFDNKILKKRGNITLIR